MKILAVVAMSKEAEPIIRALEMTPSRVQISGKVQAPIYFKSHAGHEVYLLVGGKDKVHGTDLIGSGIIPSVTLGIQAVDPDLIINVGSAGGFSQRGAVRHEVYLSDGTFKFHDRLFGPDVYHKPYGVGDYPVFEGVDELAATLNIKKARVSTGGSMLASREEEVQMQENGAVLKEMEAAHIAQVAALFEVPMFAIKGVTDLVDTAACPQEQFSASIMPLSEKLAVTFSAVLGALRPDAIRRPEHQEQRFFSKAF